MLTFTHIPVPDDCNRSFYRHPGFPCGHASPENVKQTPDHNAYNQKEYTTECLNVNT
ncbi:Uncharacterised protein [Salmonella enterica]|nr:Uncharacterised protein [Salmonella enterica]